MAKVAFTKLGLKLNKDSVKTITFNDQEIEIKQYLPVNDKLALISRVINDSYDQNEFANPVQVKVLTALEVIEAYSNINFTDKQKEDVAKLYDLFSESGLLDLIIDEIPEDEYEFLIDGIYDSIEAVYTYRQSVLGVLDTVQRDYSNTTLDATQIQESISNPENLALLKDILTKIG